ncbi:hypothetical protein [Streptomyces sp. NPDC050504]|uniref:hypothetical protein n=1 Tax=Streptomyces sp. NPDC050504 TaxID=3365618 RepID=UPI0037B11D42
MKQTTADRLCIGCNTGGLIVQTLLFTLGYVPLPVSVVCLLIGAGVMVPSVRRQQAVVRFGRTERRARRLLAQSRRASNETAVITTVLSDAIRRTEAAIKAAEKNGGLPPGEQERLSEELAVLQQQMLASHTTAQDKLDAAEAVAQELNVLLDHVRTVHYPERTWTQRLAQSLTRIAVFMAGPNNAHLEDAWHADLIGIPEEGYELSPRRRLVHAGGCIYASLRIRTTAAANRVWKPIDWILSSDRRADVLIAALVGLLAIHLSRSLHDLLTVASGPCALAYTLLKVGAARLRQVRGIELEPRAHGQDSSVD